MRCFYFYSMCFVLCCLCFLLSASQIKGQGLPNRGAAKTNNSTTVPYEEIPGEYILIFHDTHQDNRLDRVINVLNGQFAMDANTTKIAVNLLNVIFPKLNIQSADLKSITKDRLVVKLDSIDVKNAQEDSRIKWVIKNYRIKTLTETPKEGVAESEKMDWGTQSVSNNIKSNLTLSKKVWIIDSGVDPDAEELNVDRRLSRSFVPGVQYSNVDGVDAHGTHIAGIIGAKRNSKGIIGVAPNALIVAFKVIHNGYIQGYEFYLDALKAVLNEASVGDVLNLSIERTPGTGAEVELIQSIGMKGIKVSIAAGNSGRDISTYQIYPAMVSGKNIYTVAAYDQGSQFTALSNFGNPVIYCAPGDQIFSTLPKNKYGTMSGTSQAAPHFSGLLLLGGAINKKGQVLCRSNNVSYDIAHE